MDGRYDLDAATSANFLRKYGLIGEFYTLVDPILLVNVSIISLGVSVESQKSIASSSSNLDLSLFLVSFEISVFCNCACPHGSTL